MKVITHAPPPLLSFCLVDICPLYKHNIPFMHGGYYASMECLATQYNAQPYSPYA